MTDQQHPPFNAEATPAPAAPTAAQAATAPPKVRRVGTFSMGLTLICAGICLTIFCLFPSADAGIVFKLCPLVLVIFGAEMIYANTRHGSDKLKYDFFSMVICCFLVLAAGAATAASLAWEHYHLPENHFTVDDSEYVWYCGPIEVPPDADI